MIHETNSTNNWAVERTWLTRVAQEALDFGSRYEDVTQGAAGANQPAMDQSANAFLAHAEHGGGFLERVCEPLRYDILSFCTVSVHRSSAREPALRANSSEASIFQSLSNGQTEQENIRRVESSKKAIHSAMFETSHLAPPGPRFRTSRLL